MSHQNKSIMQAVFITQFFNTGILLLLSNLNLTEIRIGWLSSIFHGTYSDFSDEWYKDIGTTIVKAITVSAFMPLVDPIINMVI